MTGTRIQKLLAAQGFGSRRTIEELLAAGKVRVNGKVATLGDRAEPTDLFVLNGRAVSLRTTLKSEVLLLHKPVGTIVSQRGSGDMQTVFSLLPPPKSGRWVSVGRLDVNTSGLLIFCTDGILANRLAHPSSGFEREYLVRVHGTINTSVLQRLENGVVLDHKSSHFESVKAHGISHGSNHWFQVVLKEGRHRLVRKLWDSQGLEVSRLIRTRFAHLKLDWPVGFYQILDEKSLSHLYQVAGIPA